MRVSEPDLTILENGEIVDHYKIVRELGRGGMGEVYLARDLRLGRKVALKMVHRGAIGDEQAVIKFFREARITATFNHPHIVTVYGVGEHGGWPYVALEYIEGQTLRERVDEGRLGVRETLRVGLAIAEALREAHGHDILHRDLKPANVLLGRDGRLRVVDFGLAKQTVGTRPLDGDGDGEEGARHAPAGELGGRLLSVQTGITGTPPYMSPEQWEGAECSGATDIWALGVILYELLCGRRPFDQNTIPLLGAAICSNAPAPTLTLDDYERPEQLAGLIARCLEKRRSHRPRVQEVVESLSGLLYPGSQRPDGESNPFRGLLPFTERHADLFFGREEEVGAFLERLREESVLPVIGPSGAGKSSFVQAGVIPRLREQGRWRVLGMRPGRRPFEVLRARLLQGQRNGWTSSQTTRRGDTSGVAYDQLETVDIGETQRTAVRDRETDDRPSAVETWGDGWSLFDEARFAAQLIESPGKLALFLQQLAETEETRVLLFVDQLEELYTLVDDERVRRAFMEAMSSAADDPDGPVRVIFTLRDDFLVRLAETAGARAALGNFTVLRNPGTEALLEILTRPIERAGYAYEDHSLVEEMVADVGGELACLPLLQFACSELWAGRDRAARMIRRSAFTAMGGVAGALAQHADGVLAGLTAKQRLTARSILLRLVTPDGTRAVVAHERLVDGAGADANEVLDRLIKGRTVLVRKSEEGGGSALIELVHESLIHNWGRLQRWIDEGREEVAFLAEVGQAAELWTKRGCPVEEVWQGEALRDGLARAERVASLPDQARRFLDAGANLARRRVMRKRLAIALGFVALAIVTIVLALQNREARHQRNQAEDQRQRAEEKQAEALREGARAALSRGNLPETRAKLRSSLELQDSPLSRILWWQLRREALMARHDLGGYLYRVAFAPDGQQIAAAASNGSVYLLDVHTRDLEVLRGQTEDVTALAFTAEGGRLAAGTVGGRLVVWELATKTSRSWDGAGGVVRELAFDPTGELLAVADDGPAVRLWEAASGQRRRSFEGPASKARAVAFAPNGKWLAAGFEDRTIWVWNPVTGARLQLLEGHTARISGLAAGPGGRRLASAATDQTVRLWDVVAGRELGVLTGHEGAVQAVAFGPQGRRLVSGGEDQTVRLWDIEQLASAAVLEGHGDAVRGVAFSPDGALIASTSLDGTARLWNVEVSGAKVRPHAHSKGVLSVAVDPTGATLATGGADNDIRLWDVRTGAARGLLEGHNAGVMGMAFSPDGALLASASSDGTVRLWDVATASVRRVLRGHSDEVWDVAFDPGGRRIASASKDRTVRLWELTGGPGRVVRTCPELASNVAFGPRAGQLAVASGDKLIRLCDLEAETTRTLAGHTDTVSGVVFGPTGEQLASASWDGSVRLWSVTTQEPRVLAEREAWAWGIDFAPDGRQVGAAFSDGSAWLYGLAEQPSVALQGHRSDVNDLRFIGDGTLVATAGDDGTVRVWETATGRPYWRAPLLLSDPVRVATHRGWIGLEPGGDPVEQQTTKWREAIEQRARLAAVAEDGRTLCLANFDGAVERWELAADRWTAHELAGTKLSELRALGDACVVLIDGRVVIIGVNGEPRELARGASALGGVGHELLVAVEDGVLVFDAQSEPRRRIPAPGGATAVTLTDEWVVLGHAEGNVALVPLNAERGAPTHTFEDVPSSAVTRLLAGPMGTVVVGYVDGTLGIWKLDNGALLERRRLHGPVTHLLIDRATVYAATELGDTLTWDLGVLHEDYCELLRRVWREVPVVWEHGLPVRREPPSAHPCASGSPAGVAAGR